MQPITPSPFHKITLDIAGLGIIFYSPSVMDHVAEGEDFLQTEYMTDDQVQKYIQAGTLVGFGTGSSGTFILRFHNGAIDNALFEASDYRLRLGIVVSDGSFLVRDLYDLMYWEAEYPDMPSVKINNGIYRLTLLSRLPDSGVNGDNQVVDVFVEEWEAMPNLAQEGVPHLLSR